jgi:hypothetical protein
MTVRKPSSGMFELAEQYRLPFDYEPDEDDGIAQLHEGNRCALD